MAREMEVVAGTDFHFVGTIDKNLLCPICADPLTDPVETACGHTYCLLCICEWLRRNATCCLDKAPLRPDDLRPVNKIITSQLNELPVACARCDGKYQWQQIRDHVRVHCPHTPIHCAQPGCTQAHPRSAIEEHQAQCPHRVIVHACGASVSLMDMEDHCRRLCPDADMDCPHASFGCEWQGLRRTLPSHLVECRFESVKDVLQSQQNLIERLQGGAPLGAVPSARDAAPGAIDRRRSAPAFAFVKGGDGKTDESNKENALVESAAEGATGQLALPDAPSDLVSGVYWDYYEGTFSWLPDFEQLTPTSRGQSDGVSVGELFKKGVLNAPVNTDLYQTGDFAVRFRGYVEVPHDGEYTFYSSSNDGSRVWVAGKLVVDNDGCHYKQEVEGTVRLARGRHTIVVGYFHKNGKVLEGGLRTGIHLKVFYYYPGTNYWGRNRINKQRVPNHAFYRPLLDETVKSLKELKVDEVATAPADPVQVESDRLKAAERERDEALAACIAQTGKVQDLERQLQSAKAVAMSMEIALRHAEKDRHSALAEAHKMQACTMDLEETIADLKERYFSAAALAIKMQLGEEHARRRGGDAFACHVNTADMYDLAVARSLPVEDWPRHIRTCLAADGAPMAQTPGAKGRPPRTPGPGAAASALGGTLDGRTHMTTRSRMCRIPGSPSSRRDDAPASYVAPPHFSLATSTKGAHHQSAAF